MDRGDLPEAVRRPDGRTEPFEPERITRSLFAAAERVGRADAFLARELTEGVLHFLAAEGAGRFIAPDAIAEVVAKVVRELGHPDLAAAYEDRSRRPAEPARTQTGPEWPAWFQPADRPTKLRKAAAAAALEAVSLTHLYPPELVSAHREGLIRLTGLDHPPEFAGLSVPLGSGPFLEPMRAARVAAGEFLAVDGPEYDLAAEPGDPDRLAAGFLREVGFAADTLGVSAVLNLNAGTPPRVAAGTGPLFQAQPGTDRDRRDQIADRLAAGAPAAGLCVWWHVRPDAEDESRLTGPVRPALNGADVEFVFDRPRGPVLLGPGVDRQSPAALIQVGVNLARLVGMTGGPPVDPAVFLQKVGSLARFAKTAAHVKQDFLRKYGRPAVREAFLLDRARLVLIPLGLAEAAAASDRPPNEFARDILKALRSAAENDRPRVIPVRVDSPLGGWGGIGFSTPDQSARQQVKFGGSLHAAAGAGRLDLFKPDAGWNSAAALDAIRAAAGGTVARLRFGR